MSTPSYPMRRALHLRLEADMDAIEIASMLHGVAVDRLHGFELGQVELTQRELSELADQLALHSSWRGDPEGLRELVGPDGSLYDIAGDIAHVLGVIHEVLTAEHARRLALAAEVPDLERALPPATDPRWVHVASLWHPIGDREVFKGTTARVARDAGVDVEPFLHELTGELRARRRS